MRVPRREHPLRALAQHPRVVAHEVLDGGRHPGRLHAPDEADRRAGGEERVLGAVLEVLAITDAGSKWI
ncbi:hypothetical protein [Streptomyces spongiae]|uniref:hypothetical protein n=1 Tax=Streptomyces spongiae TaxID=565072 RepID=UPI00223F755B|nr:hypothetical protein [Streptomyces spongiae]